MSYTLIRFPQYAGKAAGLVGGGFSVVTSILSSVLVNSLSITSQTMLGVAYAVLAIGTFLVIVRTKWVGNESVKTNKNTQQAGAAVAA